MIARGEYTSHPNFVLTKHDGPNATAMMAKVIVRLYVYATRQTDDFPKLKSPSKFSNNVDENTINVPIKKEIMTLKTSKSGKIGTKGCPYAGSNKAYAAFDSSRVLETLGE